MGKLRTFIFILFLLFISQGKIKYIYGIVPEITETSQSFGRVEISLRFTWQDLPHSNQYAVWIQDQRGNVVKTLFVTSYTAQGGYNIRLDCNPLWVNRADAPNIPQAEVDSFSGATPENEGYQVYVWDGTDREGNKVRPGNYVYYVEGTYNEENRIIFSGLIATNRGPMTVESEYEYHPVETFEIFGAGMIERVRVSYIP